VRPAAASGSEHPDLAVAVGEVVGHIHETIGGEPDLALVLVDGPRATDLSSAARSVHALLRPRQLVAACGPLIATGGRLLGPGALVAAAIRHDGLVGLDVSLEAPVGERLTASSNILAVSTGDEAVSDPRLILSSVFGSPIRPIVVDETGTASSPDSVAVGFPAAVASVAKGTGWIDVGPPAIATSAAGTRLTTLDGVPVRSLLIDRLQLDDPEAEGGSERLPMLRICRVDETGSRFMPVESVGGPSDGVRLTGPVSEGDLLQLQRHDPEAAVAELVRDVRRLDHRSPSAILVSSTLEAVVLDSLTTKLYGAASGSAIVGMFDPVDGAAAADSGSTARSPDPWPRVDALIILPEQ